MIDSALAAVGQIALPLALIGLVAYLAPIPGVLVGTAYARSTLDVKKVVTWYVVGVGIMTTGVYLSRAGYDWKDYIKGLKTTVKFKQGTGARNSHVPSLGKADEQELEVGTPAEHRGNRRNHGADRGHVVQKEPDEPEQDREVHVPREPVRGAGGLGCGRAAPPSPLR